MFQRVETLWHTGSIIVYLWRNVDVLVGNVILESSLFPEIPRKIISMIYAIFGKDKDLVVDEFVLGLMASICVFATKSLIKFNYDQFLADQIHYQLLEFESLRSFRYQSYLVHLFLFF